MVKKGEDHPPVVIFTRDSMDTDKPISVVNIPPLGFVGGPTNNLIRGNMQVYWDPEIPVSAVN